MKVLNFILNFGVIWAPISLAFLVLILVAARHFFRGRKLSFILRLESLTTKRLTIFLLGAGLLFKSFLTGLQYYIWQTSGLGQFLLPPYQSWEYFARYSFWHFWLPGLLSLIMAAALYLIFYLLKRRRAEVINTEDLNLLFLLALLAGWPKFLIFLPLFLGLTLILVVVRTVAGEKTVSLIWPLISAMLLTLLFGNYLVIILGLSALAV